MALNEVLIVKLNYSFVEESFEMMGWCMLLC